MENKNQKSVKTGDENPVNRTSTEDRNKSIYGYADAIVFPSMGRYKVSVSTDDRTKTVSFVAKYEADECFDNIEDEEDVNTFMGRWTITLIYLRGGGRLNLMVLFSTPPSYYFWA